MPRLRTITHRLLQRPDPVMLELGTGGEYLVAQIRLILTLPIALIPLIHHLGGGSLRETMVGVVGSAFAGCIALLWWWLARQRGRHAWLPFTTVTWDVTGTTCFLALLSSHEPSAGLNSMVIWTFYLISIVMTALRNDGRLTLYATLLSIVQYILLGIFVIHGVENPAQLTSHGYGTADMGTVMQRVMVLGVMGAIVAAVVYRMQLLVHMSGTDGLTGLPNRTWLMHRLPSVLKKARAAGTPFSLCIIDLDHFKRINDEIGHQAGDLALQHVVNRVREQLRGDEWFARMGGEEFALLFALPVQAAFLRVDAMRQKVADAPFHPQAGHAPMRLTFSAGISTMPADGNDLSRLLSCSDARLRAAKQHGRNRVVCIDEPLAA